VKLLGDHPNFSDDDELIKKFLSYIPANMVYHSQTTPKYYTISKREKSNAFCIELRVTKLKRK